MVNDDNCVFCKIIKGEIPCHKVYEDESTLAFLDINPHAKGHTVVIPKNHGKTMFDIDPMDSIGLIGGVNATMKLIFEKLKPEGFNVGWNHNEVAGQVVPHLHVHIMPRYSGDGGGSMHSIISNPGDISVEEIAKLF